SGLALGSMLPSFTAKEWVDAAQATTCQANQTLMPIMEIGAKYPTKGAPGTLQAVIKVLNEQKSYLAASSAGGGKTTCASGQMRYFSAYDKNDSAKVWPNSFPNMMGGPT